MEQDKLTSIKPRGLAKRVIRHESSGLVIVLVVMIIALAIITKGKSIQLANIKGTILQSTTKGFAAIGQLFVLLTANIDLSIGGLALFSAVLGSAALTNMPHVSLTGTPLPLGVAILLMLVVGIGVGTINGLSVTRLGMPALIVTLAMWRLLSGGALMVTGGYDLHGLPRSLAFIGQGDIGGVPIPIIIFVVAAVVAHLTLSYTSFGRSLYAVGGNSVSAYLSGINVERAIVQAFTISGFLAVFSGLITVSRTMTATASTALGLELDSIVAVVVGGCGLAGGKGTVIGVVLGTMILGVLSNALAIIGLNPTSHDVIKGAIIFIAVLADTIRRRL